MRFLRVALQVFGALFLLVLAMVGYQFLDADLGRGSILRKPVRIAAGSFDGKVMDEATGRPIQGAAVYIAWKVDRRLNRLESILHIDKYMDWTFLGEELAFTDSTGRYELPRRTISRWVHWRMSWPKFEVLVYKPGYVAFDNVMGFDGINYTDPTQEFTGRDDVVKLKPWEERFSHANHYSFIRSILDLTTVSNQLFDEINKLALWEGK